MTLFSAHGLIATAFISDCTVFLSSTALTTGEPLRSRDILPHALSNQEKAESCLIVIPYDNVFASFGAVTVFSDAGEGNKCPEHSVTEGEAEEDDKGRWKWRRRSGGESASVIEHPRPKTQNQCSRTFDLSMFSAGAGIRVERDGGGEFSVLFSRCSPSAGSSSKPTAGEVVRYVGEDSEAVTLSTRGRDEASTSCRAWLHSRVGSEIRVRVEEAEGEKDIHRIIRASYKFPEKAIM